MTPQNDNVAPDNLVTQLFVRVGNDKIDSEFLLRMCHFINDYTIYDSEMVESDNGWQLAVWTKDKDSESPEEVTEFMNGMRALGNDIAGLAELAGVRDVSIDVVR